MHAYKLIPHGKKSYLSRLAPARRLTSAQGQHLLISSVAPPTRCTGRGKERVILFVGKHLQLATASASGAATANVVEQELVSQVDGGRRCCAWRHPTSRPTGVRARNSSFALFISSSSSSLLWVNGSIVLLHVCVDCRGFTYA